MVKSTIRRGGGRSVIQIPYSGGTLKIAYPFYGPANVRNLRGKIRQDNLLEPTSREAAFFVESLFRGKEREEKEATRIMKEGYLGCFTGILYDPKTKLANFVDYPEFDERSYVDTSNLVSRVNAGESRSQVPFEYVERKVLSWREVARNPYILAWVNGEEGAEKLAELASKHPRKEAYIYVPDLSDMKKPDARVAVLISSWGGARLGVFGLDYGNVDDGFTFGMLENPGEMAYNFLQKQNRDSEVRFLSLLKKNHEYIVKYQLGNELDVIDALAAMASDPRTDFSWLDAAGLAHQMGKRLEEELKELYH